MVTTYRLTEHHTAGGMSRFLGYLAELQPEPFCEVSPALAGERGLANGGWATVVTARASIEARVLVTDRMLSAGARPQRAHPGGEGGHVRHPARAPAPVTVDRVGFFTDTTLCIGCKACEVACKEWNAVPEDPLGFTGNSYDNTMGLGASTWRHVAFIERPTSSGDNGDADGVRWLMSSDVCKHCTNAACLEVCPTGALSPVADARAARRFTFGGAVVSQLALEVMRRRRGVTMEPYRTGPAGRLSTWARALLATGALVTAVPGRTRRRAAVCGGAVVRAGALCERFAVVRAGSQSAQDPACTVGAQTRVHTRTRID